MFNGHKNWNHWNVSLWINNDENLYSLAQTAIKHNKTRNDAVSELFELLDGLKTPNGAKYSKSAIRAAMVGM